MSKIIIEKRDRAMNSNVFVVHTPKGRFVVKLKKGQISDQDYAEKETLENLKIKNIPKILLMKKYSANTFVKVIKYINGKHIYGVLSEKEYQALLDSEEKLEHELEKIKGPKFIVNNLKKRLEWINKSTENSYIKGLSRELLEDKIAFTMENYVLSHDDLNRDNILFEKDEKGQIAANILDFESLEYAPKDYQFASMLASSLLLEGENINQIRQTIWLRGKNLERILYLMQIRTLDGLHFFIFFYRQSVSNSNQIGTDFIKRYFIANEKIKMERDKRREREGNNEEIFYR